MRLANPGPCLSWALCGWRGRNDQQPSEVGGWPSLATATPPEDADGDGIADDAEPSEPASREPKWKDDSRNAQLDEDGNGVTNLEEYLIDVIAE